MESLRRIINTSVFWSAWIIIPMIMEVIPAIGSVFLLLKRRRSERKKMKDPTFWPEISVIIPVYNSEDTLEAVVGSVADSHYERNKLHVYLVNNGSKDHSFEAYQRAQEAYPDLAMQWLNASQGKSQALNMALYNSAGKYIINIDSDGILEPNALRNLVRKFENDQNVNVMTGTIMTRCDMIGQYHNFFARLLRQCEFYEYAQAFLAGRSYASENNTLYTLSGAFSAFRKSTVLSSRLYNTATLGEDTQMTFQMRYLHHERIEICENAIFFVDPIESFNKLYVQRQRWQRGALEVAEMFPQQSSNPLKMVKDTNMHALIYDHTFAFPRLIWYFALILLTWLNYSSVMVLYAFGLIFLLYILVGYLYFLTVQQLLKINPQVRSYYLKHAWVVLVLPIYNMITFFIRVAGIINSINTTSTWRTRDLSDEGHAFKDTIRDDLHRVQSAFMKIDRKLNVQETVQHTYPARYLSIVLGFMIVILMGIIYLNPGIFAGMK